MKRLQDWEAQKDQNAMFRSLMNYLHRVETILYFVAASRIGDLHLHLQAGETPSKLFFDMDRLNTCTRLAYVCVSSKLMERNTYLSCNL